MKRTITSIAAASMALGMLVPVAFASTTTSWTHKVAGQLPIVVNGSAVSNPFELTAVDSGVTNAYFPMFYFNQALNSLGYTATWDGVNHGWNITASGVDATKISITGGVGTGNTSISVNGTVVKKINTYAAQDPGASKAAAPTTYFPAFYINEIFNGLGAKVSFSGQNGLKIVSAPTAVTGAGKISAITVTGAKVGTGTQASPAVSFGTGLTAAATLTDANGNPVTGVNATLVITANSGGAPTVTVNNASVAPSSTSGTTFNYPVATDSTGTATAAITVGANVSANYTLQYQAPFNQNSSTVAVKSANSYVEFVAPNTMGLSPGTGYNAAISTGSNNNAGLVPVTVTIPPNSNTPQNGVEVDFTLNNANDTGKFFSTSTGGALGGSTQTIYTDNNGQATVYVNATSGGSATVTAKTTNYGSASTLINWNQAGIVGKVDNSALSGYQNTSTSNSRTVYNANIGNNVTFQATAEDANGNAVPNAQLLVVNTKASAVGTDSNSAHGSYVSGTTSTGFPSVSAANLKGSTNAAQLGEVVTADASGNFSFTVTDNDTKLDHYYVYGVQGGTVSSNVWDGYVQWTVGTSLTSIGIDGLGPEVGSGDQAATGIGGPAMTSFASVAGMPVLRFDGFNGKQPISTGLNLTYNVSASGEADGSIWGIHVDAPSQALLASAPSSYSGGYYVLNPTNRGVGSVSVRVQANAVANVYDVYVNGTYIGSNVQTGWQDSTALPAAGFKDPSGNTYTGYKGDTDRAGVIQFAVTDDDSGTVKYTVTSGSQSANATVVFAGGQQEYGATFMPSQVTLSNGRTQDVVFNLEDSNGNAVPGTLGQVYFTDAQNLWVTKINGNTLSTTVPLGASGSGSGSSSEPTPIPLYDFAGLYGGSGVNMSGIGSWAPSNGTGHQVFQAYSDAKGNITFTLQDGSVSYWSGAPNYNVATSAAGGMGTMFSIYSADDQSNYADQNAFNLNGTAYGTAFQVYVGPTNPGAGIYTKTNGTVNATSNTNWDTEGTVTW